MLDEFIHEPRTAYFSMEIALRSEMPTYTGGLGVRTGKNQQHDHGHISAEVVGKQR